ncbi:uncharacterized protein [Primulina eburnea]|uniref:uncharacterized protein n=1 Tax=Primulina eburnea TaxID=1245227 RepID=UPI003C6C25B7
MVNTESMINGNQEDRNTQGNQSLTVTEITQLITATVEQVWARHGGEGPTFPLLGQEGQLEEMQKMREEIDQLKDNRKENPPLTARAVPFSTEILTEELPKNFKFPNIVEYDGKGDPEDHLARFENAALLHQYSDPIKCRVFLTTLIGSAQQWFNLLRPGDIRTFPDFSRAFLHQFASSKKHPVTPYSLFTMRQQEHEGLRAYMRRFSAVVIEVPSATSDLLIGAFIQGLTTKDFLKSLIKKPASTYDELLARAEKYVNLEEVQIARAHQWKEPPSSPKRPKPVKPDPRSDRPTRSESLGEFATYTPLKVSKLRALQICENKYLIQRPRGSDQGPRRPRSDKYCDFHKDYGHTTDECKHLGHEIERIVQQDA